MPDHVPSGKKLGHRVVGKLPTSSTCATACARPGCRSDRSAQNISVSATPKPADYLRAATSASGHEQISAARTLGVRFRAVTRHQRSPLGFPRRRGPLSSGKRTSQRAREGARRKSRPCSWQGWGRRAREPAQKCSRSVWFYPAERISLTLSRPDAPRERKELARELRATLPDALRCRRNSKFDGARPPCLGC